MANGCIFCQEYSDPGSSKLFLGEDWPFEDRELFKDPFVFAVAGYGPQVYPYALVLTRRHIQSLGETSDDERRSIIKCLEFLRSSPPYADYDLVVFEHGGVSHLEECMSHFHLHVIAGHREVLERNFSSFPRVEIRVTEEDCPVVPDRYLLLGALKEEGICGYVADSASCASQFFRRALAQSFGDGRYDWRLGMNPDYMALLKSSIDSFRKVTD